MIASVLQATTAASSTPQPQVQKQLKGKDRHIATVSPKSEEGVFMHPGQASLSLSLGLERLLAVFKSCIYQVTAQKECVFSFSWGRGGGESAGLKPQII